MSTASPRESCHVCLTFRAMLIWPLPRPSPVPKDVEHTPSATQFPTVHTSPLTQQSFFMFYSKPGTKQERASRTLYPGPWASVSLFPVPFSFLERCLAHTEYDFSTTYLCRTDTRKPLSTE